MLITSCSNNTLSDKEESIKTEIKDTISTNDTIPEVAKWADDYIIEYLEANKDKLTEIDSVPISFMKDFTTQNNTKYVMVQIGHSFEYRFETEQTIYIDSLTKELYEYDVISDSLILWENKSQLINKNEIPKNGKYHFDIAFAEWQGKSMGEKVVVIIKGYSIKIIYEGDGQLSNAEKGDIIDEGLIMKHKSGVWIIGTKPSDKELDEIGGCTEGPSIIDFKNKKYWVC